MSYKLILSPEAEEDLKKHAHSGNKPLLKKISSLMRELEEHPTIGTGKPEALTGNMKGQWSRRITGQHRLVYRIHEEIITVILIRAWGHYGDK